MSVQRIQTMVVTGTGSVTGKSDLVTIQLGIITLAEQLGDAQAENTKRSQSVISRLAMLGVKENDIQTSSCTVSPQYDYIDGQQHFRDYEVRHHLRVTSRAVSSIGSIIDAAVQSGATEVSSIQFGIEQTTDLYEQALSKAVENAKAHAQALASAAEVVLNQVPVTIQENSQSDAVPFAVQMGEMAANPKIVPGMLDIRATVTIMYSYR